MKLDVTDKTQLKHLQEGFHKLYPNLWINFFRNNGVGASDSKRDPVDPDMLVKNLPGFRGADAIDISGERQVLQLEKDFQEFFGLGLTTLRKSGSVWVQTLYTGNWTLDNQNHKGGEISLD